MSIKFLGKNNLLLVSLGLILIIVSGLIFSSINSKKPPLMPLTSDQSLLKVLENYGDYKIREGNYDPKLGFIKNMGKLSSKDFPKKVTEICETLKIEEKQMCYSYSGANMFLNNPSNPAESLPACDKLLQSTNAGENRTPSNFCGSGVWGEFFNNVTTADILSRLKPTISQLIELCINQNNFSNLTCYQEFGKYAMINKSAISDSELYTICNNISKPQYRDQCESGVGRGIALKSTGNFLQLNVRCSTLTNDDFTVKCLNSLGMDSNKDYFARDLSFCKSPLNSLGDLCFYNYGKFAFGYNHGSIKDTLLNCQELSTINTQYLKWCTLGIVNSFIHANLLYKTYSGISSVKDLCHDLTLIENNLVSECYSNFFMNFTIKTEFTTPANTLEFCQSDKQCYWSIGYSAKDELMDLKQFCPPSYMNLCLAGYQRKLIS